jgi:hypothetical protein
MAVTGTSRTRCANVNGRCYAGTPVTLEIAVVGPAKHLGEISRVGEYDKKSSSQFGYRRNRMGMSFVEELRRAEALQDADPWRLRLEQLRGQLGHDGVERLTVQMVLNVLEVPMRNRTSTTYRRLNKLMVECGWQPLRVRALNAGGHKDRLRGFARYPIQPA